MLVLAAISDVLKYGREESVAFMYYWNLEELSIPEVAYYFEVRSNLPTSLRICSVSLHVER